MRLCGELLPKPNGIEVCAANLKVRPTGKHEICVFYFVIARSDVMRQSDVIMRGDFFVITRNDVRIESLHTASFVIASFILSLRGVKRRGNLVLQRE